MPKRIAIIGASDFQNPLILKAKERGLETHVFAWRDGSIGEKTADFYYPISITEIDEICDICRKVGVDGICTIGSDLGNITVSQVAERLGLVANSVATVEKSTNKHLMRQTFEQHGDPSPKSRLIRADERISDFGMAYPLIVKPVDRSGSRSITKLDFADTTALQAAVKLAIDSSFAKEALIEEYMAGEEFSVEYVSWEGVHHFLALTKKFTSGAPHFIETGHLEPAPVSEEIYRKIKQIVPHALESLGVRYGASHSELMLLPSGEIKIVEIASRMGGDCIGSDLVPLSTGIDFVGAVIDCALGEKPRLVPSHAAAYAMIRFIFDSNDIDVLNTIQTTYPELIDFVSPIGDMSIDIVDSASRHGFYILKSSHLEDLIPYLPAERH